MSHYFTNNDEVKSVEKEFQVEILGTTFKFLTDHGVFSKGELDFASRLLIETFAALELIGDVLDVGCGYGPIGISLAKKRPETTVHMIDVNLRALDLATRNGALNGVSNVLVYESSMYENVERKFSHIISNPPIRAGKKIVHGILSEAIHHLEDGGTLTVVIGKQHGAASAQKLMEEVFGNVTRVERKKGFWILHSTKEGETAKN